VILHSCNQELCMLFQAWLSPLQLLIFGSLARCFRAWSDFTAEQNVKRTVFAQKQAAIKVRQFACIHL
jgi:hypothetical protein